MSPPRDPAPGAADPAADALADLAFEGALDELEALVERLETGDLELEAALAAFERGVALSRRCAALLERAERRIDELVHADGAPRVRPLDSGEK